MSTIPFEIHTISNPEDLYGRESLLKKLTVLAKRKENTEILGARRFGKTCMLKSMHTLIRKSGNISVYPVYLDFKIADVHGTEAAYQYMISELVKLLFSDGVFTEPQTIGVQIITPTDDQLDIEEQLSRKLPSSPKKSGRPRKNMTKNTRKEEPKDGKSDSKTV